MNVVIQALREHIANQNVRFVFPSQTAAGLWAIKTCTLGIARSVASNRFLAWDRFKEEAITERDATRHPATSVMRKLFAEALIRENGEKVFLKALLPPEYAGGGRVFAPFIARLLPSLAYWERLIKKTKEVIKDAEDEDYALIQKQYAAFLERYKLFEPAWEEQKVSTGDLRYVIFFPELIEDFAEYSSLLEAPRFIRVGIETSLLSKESSREYPFVFFKSAREEIRTAVMELQRQHVEQGIPYEDMAVSVPELEEMEPCLLKEFSLRHIPVTRRAGKKLGEAGAGRLFSLVNECISSRFSFDSFKALILNGHVPWKEMDKNKALINFGIKFNCVSGYVQDGKEVDIWEEAFKGAFNSFSAGLLPYYRELKKRIFAFASAKNFVDIRKCYFAFRGSLLDMEKISKEDNAILSRCIEELSSLIELEEKFNEPNLIPVSPIGFFISCLGDTDYVTADQTPGVNIFKWRVAAASPYSCHFVLNASQSAATVLYQPLNFLRQDKRKALSIEDSDASGAFLLLSNTGEDEGFKSRTRISASAQTFSGWAIPHSYFDQSQVKEAPSNDNIPLDPYREERRFWKEETAFGQLFPLQKHSFDLWKNNLVDKKNNYSFFDSPVSADTKISGILKKNILGDAECLTVTPTRDLNVYYHCPVSWLYARIFGLEEYSLEAELLDDISLGLLYHKILEQLFAKIKNEDNVFNSSRLDIYKNWTLEITKAAIKNEPAFKGPLAAPLVLPQAAGITRKIARLLELEAKSFDGYKIAELEYAVSLKTEELFIKGVIDRVSMSPSGEPVIIDYKTTYLPEQTAVEDLASIYLSEFQMPLYIKLYEEQTSAGTEADTSKVQGAFFYNINGRRIKTVMGEITGSRSKAPNREEYDRILEAAQEQIKHFAQNVKTLNFVPHEIRIKDCLGCVYKTVCRSVYFAGGSNV